MVNYSLSFIGKLFLEYFIYILSESVVMVSLLQSLGINIQDYCIKYSNLLEYRDPLANPLLAIGVMNIVGLYFVIWNLATEQYVLKEE